MRWILSVVLVFVFFMFVGKPAHAIIFLPAIVLIPIAKIVALIVGGFSMPALGLGALWSKLFGKSLKRTIGVTMVLLIIIAVVLMFVFKIFNPTRPLF